MALATISETTANESSEDGQATQGQGPCTLRDAALILDRDRDEWLAANPPAAKWFGMRTHLADAERAVEGLIAVTSVLRQHYFAREVAPDRGDAYSGITDFQAGGLEAAVEALAWLAQGSLSSAREVIVSGETP